MLKAIWCSLPCLLLISAIASAQEGHLLVAQKGDRSLAIVTPAGRVLGSVPEGGITGHEVAASPDGRLAIVPIYGNSGVGKPGTDGTKIAVIDIGAQKVVGEIAFDHGVRPHCAVFGPKNGMLYVTTELDKTVTVIDPKTLKVVATIPTGQPESHMLAISHDGRRGYTANVGPGTVSGCAQSIEFNKSALVDDVAQPERHQVRVRGDVGAVDLEVVARVGDHGQLLGGDQVQHPACQLGAAGATGEDHNWARLGQGRRV